MRKYFVHLKISFTLILLYLLFSYVDLNAVFSQYAHINALIIIPILLYGPALYISTVRWMLVLPKNHLNTKELFINYWISNFFSQFLPSSIGGDSYRVMSLRKKYGTFVIARSVFFDRFSGLIAVAVVGFPSLFLFGSSMFDYRKVFLVFIALAVVGCVVLYFIYKNKKLDKYADQIHDTLHLFKQNAFYSVVLSFVFLCLGAFSLWIYFIMFGHSFNFFTVLSIYSILQLISMLPISINGIGVTETALVFFFSTLGVPAEVSLGIAILARVVMLGQTGVGGVLYLAKEK